jgi:hypothetical protein
VPFALLCICACVADGFRGTGYNYASPLYFVAAIAIGLYLVLTLFITILLERFAAADSEELVTENHVNAVRCLTGSPVAVQTQPPHHVPCVG